MKFLKSFFRYTRIFWTLSRLFLVFVFGYCAFFLLEGADMTDYVSAGFFAFVALTFLWNFLAGLFKVSATKWTGYFLGTILVLAGILGLYATTKIFGFADSWTFILGSLYFILAGLFEFAGMGARSQSKNPATPKINLGSLPK